MTSTLSVDENSSDVNTVTTWGSNWPQVGITRSQLYNSIIKTGYESESYLEVSAVISHLIDWANKNVTELDQKISNAENPDISPALCHSLKKLKDKIVAHVTGHLAALRQRVRQLRSEDSSVLDLFDLVTNEDQDSTPIVSSASLDQSFAPTLLDLPNNQIVNLTATTTVTQVTASSMPASTAPAPLPNWSVSGIGTNPRAAQPIQIYVTLPSESWVASDLDQLHSLHVPVHNQLALTGQYSSATLTRHIAAAIIRFVPPPNILVRLANQPSAEYDLRTEINTIRNILIKLNSLRVRLNDIAFRRRLISDQQEKDILDAMGLALDQRMEQAFGVFDQLEDQVKRVVGQEQFERMVSSILPNFQQSIAATVGFGMLMPNPDLNANITAPTTNQSTVMPTTTIPVTTVAQQVTTPKSIIKQPTTQMPVTTAIITSANIFQAAVPINAFAPNKVFSTSSAAPVISTQPFLMPRIPRTNAPRQTPLWTTRPQMAVTTSQMAVPPASTLGQAVPTLTTPFRYAPTYSYPNPIVTPGQTYTSAQVTTTAVTQAQTMTQQTMTQQSPPCNRFYLDPQPQ